MSVLEIVGIPVGSALITFYVIVRVYSLRFRRGELKDWDQSGIFCFAVVMGVIWPLTLLWLLATRPTRAERKETERLRTIYAIKRFEQQETLEK